MSENASLFERIGGMGAVNAAVDIFYTKVIADDRINHFFVNIDMEAFLAYAFGAPMVTYSGKQMREAHAGMNLTEDHFNAVAGNLVATLNDLSVPQNLIDEVLAIAMTTKNDVLGL